MYRFYWFSYYDVIHRASSPVIRYMWIHDTYELSNVRRSVLSVSLFRKHTPNKADTGWNLCLCILKRCWYLQLQLVWVHLKILISCSIFLLVPLHRWMCLNQWANKEIFFLYSTLHNLSHLYCCLISVHICSTADFYYFFSCAALESPLVTSCCKTLTFQFMCIFK